MNILIPELETKRLKLLAPTEAHVDACAAIYGDPDVMKFVTSTKSRQEAWEIIARRIGHWVMRGYGGWTVAEKSGEEIVGFIGLMNPADNPAPEIGWVFGRNAWGKGYASEAAQAAIEYAFNVAKLDRLIARVTPGNDASLRVAAKLGMTVVPLACTEDTITLALMRSDE